MPRRPPFVRGPLASFCLTCIIHSAGSIIAVPRERRTAARHYYHCWLQRPRMERISGNGGHGFVAKQFKDLKLFFFLFLILFFFLKGRFILIEQVQIRGKLIATVELFGFHRHLESFSSSWKYKFLYSFFGGGNFQSLAALVFDPVVCR